MRVYSMLDVKLNRSCWIISCCWACTTRWNRWKWAQSRKTGRSHEKTKPKKLDDGLLRHGGGAVRRADAAGGRDPHCHVHCACAGRVSDRDSVCGVRAHHALTAYAAVSLLALLFVPDKEVALIFVFLLGITRWQNPGSTASARRCCGGCASCCCATARCWPCTACCWCSSGGQYLTGAAHHAWIVTLSTLAMGNVAFCCTTGPAQPAHAVPVGVAAQAAPDAGHALRTIVAQQLHKMGKCGILSHQQPTGAAERGNAKLPVDAKRRATRVTAVRVTRRGIIESFGGCSSG